MENGLGARAPFHTPDFVKYAESFGAKGYQINRTEELLPTLKFALEDDAVSVITCPVEYSQNMELTDKLGLVTEAL
jgi:acetolactate synthase-1/2/3 large subunit